MANEVTPEDVEAFRRGIQEQARQAREKFLHEAPLSEERLGERSVRVVKQKAPKKLRDEDNPESYIYQRRLLKRIAKMPKEEKELARLKEQAYHPERAKFKAKLATAGERLEKGAGRLEKMPSKFSKAFIRKRAFTQKQTMGLRKLLSPEVEQPKVKRRFAPRGYVEGQSNLNPRNIQQLEEQKRFNDIQRAKFNSMQMSKSTQEILDSLRNVQTLGARSNLEMQRRIRERRAIELNSLLLRTPSLFGKNSATMNVLGKDEFQITDAQNLFSRNNPNNVDIMSMKDEFGNQKPTIMQAENIFKRNENSIDILNPTSENNLFSQENSRKNQLRFF